MQSDRRVMRDPTWVNHIGMPGGNTMGIFNTQHNQRENAGSVRGFGQIGSCQV